MSDEILLSLCVPTNGVVEWVKPVLDSIYAETNPIGEFEVVVTDNGNNEIFEQFMTEFCTEHENCIYQKTDAIQFENQIECFKLASGEFIKFVNHRMMLQKGALNYLLKYVLEHKNEKPVTYFLEHKPAGEYANFDSFIKGMSYWSSYSAGTAMWRDDFKSVDFSQSHSSLFPHTDMIFAKTDSEKYILDNFPLFKSVPTDETKKGKYNLFYAFGVEYPSLILELYRKKLISHDTLESVINDNYELLSELYLDYVLLKRPCSYELTNIKENLKVFYAKKYIRLDGYRQYVKRVIKFVKWKIKGE